LPDALELGQLLFKLLRMSSIARALVLGRYVVLGGEQKERICRLLFGAGNGVNNPQALPILSPSNSTRYKHPLAGGHYLDTVAERAKGARR
jgi:hypothetical protein